MEVSRLIAGRLYSFFCPEKFELTVFAANICTRVLVYWHRWMSVNVQLFLDHAIFPLNLWAEIVSCWYTGRCIYYVHHCHVIRFILKQILMLITYLLLHNYYHENVHVSRTAIFNCNKLTSWLPAWQLHYLSNDEMANNIWLRFYINSSLHYIIYVVNMAWFVTNGEDRNLWKR